MGKVLKVVAAIVAIGVVVFAPYLAPLVAGALGFGGTIATALVALALTAGASLLMRSVISNRPTTQTPAPQVFRQSISNSFIAYGRRRLGGLLVFFHSRKVGKDHYRYFVIACTGHRCAGNPTFMLGDEIVTVDGSNKVTSGPYANAAWLWFQRGLDNETANATFVSECGGKWTSAHKGNNVAAIYAKFKMTDAVIEAGMPNITVIVDGKDDIFDPRDASTVYTNNAALVFYDWMALPREEGGFGAYADEIPSDDWISAQANVSDETVEGEARYALDGVITTGAAPSEIRDTLVINCAGSYTFSEGRHLLRVGYWVPPSETLSEVDLAGGITVSPFLTGDQAANEAQGTYYEPSSNFQPAPFSTKTSDPAPDDVRQLDLDLPFITSKHRGERVATIMLRRAAAEKTVVWPMNIAGLSVGALDVVQLGTARYGLSNYAFVVTNWSLSADFGVVLNLREENEGIYDEPDVVTPASVNTIDQPEPLSTATDIALRIATSRTEPTKVLEATESGGGVTITIIAHDRVYQDGTRTSIASDSITGLTPDTAYWIYYDDDTLIETSPAFAAVLDAGASDAQSGAAQGRHSLGRIRGPTSGSGSTFTGGGAYAPGLTVGGEIP